MKDEKSKALDAALKQLEGMNISINRVGDKTIEKVGVISTGSLGLDNALGVGGYPRGKMIELFGKESSGKSALSLIAMGIVQKMGGIAVLLDVEHSFEPQHAADLGVDVDNLRISQPEYGEQAMEAISILCRSNAVDLIVLDSTAALVPKAEHDGNMERKSMGEQARLLSQALRKLVGDVGKSNTAVIFINQIRNKVGVMFGNPETTPGGLALKFYSSVRLEIKRMSGKDSMRTDSKDDAIGNRVKVKVVKNKCAVPYKECEFDLYFNKGIDVVSEISDLALRKEIVTVAGNTYSFEKHKWVGRAKFDEAIKEDVKLQEKLKDLILHENIEIRPDKLPVAHKD